MRRVIIFVIATALGFAAYSAYSTVKTPQVKTEAPKTKQKTLLAYTFDSLSKTRIRPTGVTWGESVEKKKGVRSNLFSYETPSKPGGETMLRVSGIMNAPDKPGTYPVIIMLRGFVPDDIYEPGVGTQRAAEVLAENGYITLAPDFLGFATSDKPSTDSFEARFQTYTTVLSLLENIKTINESFNEIYDGQIQVDTQRVGLWGHSNGGHIALSVLAITGNDYPTVLWAPVSKPFPYSILFYTDEAQDHGKALRKVLADFETDYDSDMFSPQHYYQWIHAPILVEQGSADPEVPQNWSDDLVSALEDNGLEVEYHIREGADHNLMPSWQQTVNSSVSFFDSSLKKIPSL